MTLTEQIRLENTQRRQKRAERLYRRKKNWKTVASLMGFNSPSWAWTLAHRKTEKTRERKTLGA